MRKLHLFFAVCFFGFILNEQAIAKTTHNDSRLPKPWMLQVSAGVGLEQRDIEFCTGIYVARNVYKDIIEVGFQLENAFNRSANGVSILTVKNDGNAMNVIETYSTNGHQIANYLGHIGIDVIQFFNPKSSHRMVIGPTLGGSSLIGFNTYTNTSSNEISYSTSHKLCYGGRASYEYMFNSACSIGIVCSYSNTSWYKITTMGAFTIHF